MTALKTKDDFAGRPRYELIGADGRTYGTYSTALDVGTAAHLLWPDQAQDEDRTGKGWDVQICGCE